MSDPRLGRVPDPPDDRDHDLGQHLSLGLLATPIPASHAGARPKVLDQGQTPDCVGFSGATIRAVQERADEHRTLTFDGADLYALAKLVDGYAGDGTDIRSAAKQLVSQGARVLTSPVHSEVGKRRNISVYARLSTLAAVKLSILTTGAAWAGSSWYESWFDPWPDGTLPAPNSVAGGHAYTLLGWSDKRAAFRGQNSWGASWAVGGRFWLPYAYVDFADFDLWSTIDVPGDK